MARTGGPATIYGILFQILGTMRHALQLTLEATVQGKRVTSARLILEPEHGGDLVIHQGVIRIVEQWKSRRSSRLWTFREIVRKVLPDLFRATDVRRLQLSTTYRFVAEGEIADCSIVIAFFRRLRAVEATHFTLEKLDDTTPVLFLPGRSGRMTERRFFLWIADEITAIDSHQGGSSGDLHKRLCHLLQNFDVISSATASEMEGEIDSQLNLLVDREEDVAKCRHELCGRLMRLAKAGNAVIRPAELLRQAGIDAVPLTRWRDVGPKLNRKTYESDLAPVHYQEELDVRRSLPWPANCSVVVIAGPSGVGKSWHLASQVTNSELSDSAYVFIRASGRCNDDIQAAADIVWQTGFEHDSSIPLGRLAHRLRGCNPTIQIPWLTLLIEDVRSSEELIALLEQPWSEWGVRLAITVPERFAAMLKDEGSTRNVQIRQLERFTLTQLRDYLRRTGRDWTGIPPDVAEHLRLPLIARIYCQLNADTSWRPTSEYDVFAAMWKLLESRLSQADHPDDQASLRSLAGSLLQPGSEYPWSLKLCRESGLDSDVITRLEQLGWLSRENGRVAAWHNRLLNWTVAEALSEKLRFGGTTSIQEVCEILKTVLGEDATVAGQFLGYVFMDLLWLLSAHDHPQRSSSHHVIKAIEETWAPNGFPKHLYQESLPTLGQRIADGIVRRTRESAELVSDWTANLAADALTAIGPPAANESAALLLNETGALCNVTALRVLAKHPAPDQLDKVWSIYKNACLGDRHHEDRDGKEVLDRASANALRACAPLDLPWLLDAILVDGKTPRLAWLLASILCSLGSPEADLVWTKGSSVVIEALQDGADPLARCIRRFRDTTRIPLMESWALSGEPKKSVPGFETLCALAPERAVSLLDQMSARQLGWLRTWYEPLNRALPVETRSAIRKIMARSPKDAVDIGQVYRDRTHRLDVESLETLFDALDKLLDLDKEQGTQNGPLAHLLGLLARVDTIELLERFQTIRNSPLETKLSERACQWLVDPKLAYDIELREVPNILLRIGGSGHTRFVNAQLRHSNLQTALRGIEAATIHPNNDRAGLLIALSERDDDSTVGRRAGYVQRCAIEALAALGADRYLILAILKHGADVHGIRFFRGGQVPISDQDLAPAFNGLRSDSLDIRQRALFAIGVSDREDLIPRVKAALMAPGGTVEDRFGALWALYGLNAGDDESMAWFSGQLHDTKCRHVAILGLLQSERPEARKRLIEELDKIDPDTPGGEGWLPAILAQHADSRPASINFAWKSLRGKSFFHTSFRNLDLIRLLGEVQDPEVTDFLLQEADPSDRGMHVVGRRRAAIRALQQHDSEAAFEAAVAWLTRSGRDRHFASAVIFGIDVERGIPLVCDQLAVEKNRFVRRSICVALRHSGRDSAIDLEVKGLLQGDADKRHAAAQIMQWMGPHFLSETLNGLSRNETSAYVRHAIFDALVAREREAEARHVLHALSNSTGMDQWRFVDALFNLAEPEQLGRPIDPLWMGRILERFPPALQQHFDKRWEKALEHIQKELERPGDA